MKRQGGRQRETERRADHAHSVIRCSSSPQVFPVSFSGRFPCSSSHAHSLPSLALALGSAGAEGGLDFGIVKVMEDLKQPLQLKNRGKYEIMFR